MSLENPALHDSLQTCWPHEWSKDHAKLRHQSKSLRSVSADCGLRIAKSCPEGWPNLSGANSSELRWPTAVATRPSQRIASSRNCSARHLRPVNTAAVTHAGHPSVLSSAGMVHSHPHPPVGALPLDSSTGPHCPWSGSSHSHNCYKRPTSFWRPPRLAVRCRPSTSQVADEQLLHPWPVGSPAAPPSTSGSAWCRWWHSVDSSYSRPKRWEQHLAPHLRAPRAPRRHK